MADPRQAGAGAPGPDPDWTVQVADAVERVVGSVRDKTTVPLTTVARALVFGLLAAIMGLAALVLVSVGLVRAVNTYLPGDVWSAHLLVGGIFTCAGALLLRAAGSTAKSRRRKVSGR